ncbi:outer membrane protein assembly factor BamE [Budviciaceae bacterium BWR-B9]|uniref:Outer membrane protein assembly factor BamE n=2 Tax=Budviciaceae TaxID=1903416 RepID=A0ABS1IV90_9GAMM|nr:outer membrane protein assembly factor BamE [Limnobaculum allomyrinae]MBV7692616.1 outer membrane protein assembly factor BamE [Limnobaculum sp. M2-1]
MIVHSKPVRLAMVLGCFLLLSACTRSISDVDSQGKTTSPVFPGVTSAVREEGSFVNLDNLKQIKPGMTKTQLYELIGVPHFDEGVLKVKEWDYIFHFTKADNTILTCQYKVLFDSNMKAQSFYFLPENCLEQLSTKPVVVHHDLSVEGLFAFDQSAMSMKGIESINAFSAGLKNAGLENRRIIVTGHTDRFGGNAYNQRLSLARAESVKREMVKNGIPASIIAVQGKGDSEPRVSCPGNQSAVVISCLAPNRRMSVDVVNQQSK